MPGSPCLSKTGLMLARIDGQKGHWSMSRCGPEPGRFFGDPTSLARNNMYGYGLMEKQELTL